MCGQFKGFECIFVLIEVRKREALNGEDIDSKIKYNAILSTLTIGSEVQVKFVRNGFERTETVTVTENTLNW